MMAELDRNRNRSAAEEIELHFREGCSAGGLFPLKTQDSVHVSVFQKLLDDGLIMYVDPGERHKVEFTDSGWFIMHPLSCRRESGSLFGCDFTTVASDQFREPEYRGQLGTFEIEMTADGELIRLLDRVQR